MRISRAKPGDSAELTIPPDNLREDLAFVAKVGGRKRFLPQLEKSLL